MAPASYASLDLGGMRVTTINAGRFALDGGAMYGVVPRPLWARVTPPDDRHRIPMACNCLVVETPHECILIDAGLGQRFDARAREIFDVDTDSSLQNGLSRAGIDPEQITHVLFTHLHFDHSAGALTTVADKVRPTFVNAQHLAQDGEIDDGLACRSIMGSSYVPSDISLLRTATRLEGISGDTEIFPGVHVEVTGGHTEHHQAVWLRGREQTLVYPADLLPTRHHLRPYWIMAYDMFPHETLTVKHDFIRRILEQDCIVAWDHDPLSPFSHLRKTPDGVEAIDIGTMP